MAGAPDVVKFLPFLGRLSSRDDLGAGLATTLVPALAATLFIAVALTITRFYSRFSGSVSISRTQISALKATFFIMSVICGIWLVALGGIIFAMKAFDSGIQRSQSVANGSIYVAVFLFTIILNLAIIAPGLQMLQPMRLWRIRRAQRNAKTPRQHFRGECAHCISKSEN